MRPALVKLAAAAGTGLIATVAGMTLQRHLEPPAARATPVAEVVSDPTAIIKAPATAMAGDLVILDAGDSTAADFAWALVPSNKSFLPVDGGRRCVFSAGTPGRYTFALAVAQADRVALATHTLVLESSPSPGPQPGPGPVPPGPEPGPDLPPGKFQLAKLARDWALELVPLEPQVRRQAAHSLASSFNSTAAAIAAGTLATPAMILEQTKASNQNSLGQHVDAWKPWGARLADHLESLNKAGKLSTPDDYATAWREIAVGLGTVASGQ